MASNQTALAPGVVEVVTYPTGQQDTVLGTAARNLFIVDRQCRRAAADPKVDQEKARRLGQARIHLSWMQNEVRMSPSISATRRKGLRDTFDIILGPESCIPYDIRLSVLELKQKWDTVNWGDDAEAEADDNSDSDADAAGSVAGHGNHEVPTTQVALPPKDHPIFGDHGMMHGILVLRSATGRVVYRMDPRVSHKSPREYGHNGIPVGAWWPLQIAALHDGAHGARVGGIAGDVSRGAYSIVVAALYRDLDQDEGDTLYYSGSNSHDNKDPVNPPKATLGTKALNASLATRRDVRVLRSGGSSTVNNHSRCAPEVGLRYDGLYTVVNKFLAKNSKGGVYEQFKLVRKSGQVPWHELDRIPSLEQARAIEMIQRGY